jgi:hypothetical protein
MADLVCDAKNLAKHITLTVKMKRTRQWRWRVKLAAWLIRLAALVMWVNVEIEAGTDFE